MIVKMVFGLPHFTYVLCIKLLQLQYLDTLLYMNIEYDILRNETYEMYTVCYNQVHIPKSNIKKLPHMCSTL